MKILFVHDHKFRRVGNEIYSPGGLPDEVLARYSKWFGSIIVVGRILEEAEIKSNYSRIENPDVCVLDKSDLKELVKEADGLILRLPSLNGYLAAHYARQLSKPYLVEVVGCTWDAYWNYGAKGKLFALGAFLIMRHYVNKAPYAVYVTRDFLQRRYPCKGRCAAISDVALDDLDASILTKRLDGMDTIKDKLIIGTAAVVDVAYKGQEYVIRALPELNKRLGRQTKLEYQLVGHGNPERLMRVAQACGVADQVVFCGTLAHNKVFEWMDKIDIYIQPSLLEGLSRALVEAMSRGLPCVATRCGGNPELIEETYLVSPTFKGTIPGEIGKCVLRLCDPQERKEQAKRNYREVQLHYSRDELNDKRSTFYLDFRRKIQAHISV